MGKFIDLTGQRFGKLVVLFRAKDYVSPSNKPSVVWHCRCDCGNECDVLAHSLKSGHTISCGCYFLEVATQKGINSKKFNNYNFDNDYGICYAHNTKEEIIFDLEDYEKISHYCWSVYKKKHSEYKVVTARINGKNISLSHYLIGYTASENDAGIVVDHINRNPLDNRKNNLRKCLQKENIYNRCKLNKIGVGLKGVGQHSSGRYYASIVKDGQKYWLGTFNTLKEAADAYDTKAKELFGEFAYLNNYQEPEENQMGDCGVLDNIGGNVVKIERID